MVTEHNCFMQMLSPSPREWLSCPSPGGSFPSIRAAILDRVSTETLTEGRPPALTPYTGSTIHFLMKTFCVRLGRQRLSGIEAEGVCLCEQGEVRRTPGPQGKRTGKKGWVGVSWTTVSGHDPGVQVPNRGAPGSLTLLSLQGWSQAGVTESASVALAQLHGVLRLPRIRASRVQLSPFICGVTLQDPQWVPHPTHCPESNVYHVFSYATNL